MTETREIAPATGQEFKPALGKLWVMLLVFLFMIPAGVVGTFVWWNQIEIVPGKVLNSAAGIALILAVPLGLLLSQVMFALIATAKRLVIGDDCVQLLSKDRVAVHIPYSNLAEVYSSGDSGAGVVGLRLRNRQDPATLVPSHTKDAYEIQVLTYGQPHTVIHQAIEERWKRSGARQSRESTENTVYVSQPQN